MSRRRTILAVQLLIIGLLAAACSTQSSTSTSVPTPVGVSPSALSPTPVPPSGPTPSPSPTEPEREPFVDAPVSEFVVPAAWSDPLPLHPETIETRLDNGLRIIVRRNTAPGTQAHLRLVVDAGSIDEDPAHPGTAHFLEHMMFNGTERFPGNELVPVLEGFGAGFGPDVNAYTGFEETVYQLTVPTGTAGALELGLDVLAEWASRATIDSSAVVAERGVVREEWRRGRETVGGRLAEVVRDVVLGDTIYLEQLPIGTIESIDAMSEPELRAFYERWYRPDRMAIVAVGDFDARSMLAMIEQRFAGLANPPNAPFERESFGTALGLSEPVFDVYTDPELSRPDVTVRWRTAAVDVRSPAELRQQLALELALRVTDRRLFELVERGSTEATSASLDLRGAAPEIGVVTLTGRSNAAEVTGVLVDLLQVVEQVRQHGVSAGEFDRAVSELRSGFEQTRAEADRRQDSTIAAGYTSYLLGVGVEPDPDLAFERAIEVLETLEPIDVQVVLHRLLETDPYVLVTAPSSAAASVPAPEALATAYGAAVGWVVPEAPESPTPPELLIEPPEPATITSTEVDSQLDTRIVTYENGVRLAVRPTNIVDGRIEFQAWSRGGFFLHDADVAPLLRLAGALVLSSGFESIDAVDLDHVLGDRVVELTGDVSRSTETLSGEASPEDLETLFALIHLQMTEPTISDLSVRRFDATWRPLAENPSIRPSLAGDLALWRLRYGDSPWFRRLPTIEDLDDLDPDRQLEAWKQRFANAADFVFVFVGDLEPDRVVELGARYLGTLPTDDEREQSVDRDPGVPQTNLVETVEAGIGDRGRLRINWESPYPFTIEATVVAEALELVVNARLRDLVREELAASYAPSASVGVLSEPKPWVDTIIEMETDPDRVEEVSDAVHAELARLRAGDLDQRYLDLAIDQLVERYRFVSNPQWLDRITFHLVNPDRSSGEFRQRSGIVQRLTLADLADAAQVIFPAERSVEVRLVPER